MRLTCLPEKLNAGLATVGRVVAPRSTLPVLGNVLLATDGGQLKLAATNLELTVICWVGGEGRGGGRDHAAGPAAGRLRGPALGG